eukprot:m.149466 g.149466  ORF g.149466 m.149466 type:complete len:664 (+) comp17347_c0_seq5:246-2237(+)
MAELAFANPYAASMDADGLPIDTDAVFAELHEDDEPFRTQSAVPPHARVILSGLLIRSPVDHDLDTDMKGGARPWTKRFCVLRDVSPQPATLDFYLSEADFASARRPPIGRVTFDTVVATEIVPGVHRYSFLFNLQQKHQFVYFSAPGKDELLLWLHALNDAVAQQKSGKPMSPPFDPQTSNKMQRQVPHAAYPAEQAAPTASHASTNQSAAHVSKPWFYGKFSRNDAVKELERIHALRRQRTGVFLVRDSTTAGAYALSYIDETRRVSHVQVLHGLQGFAFKDSGFSVSFPSLVQLIDSEELKHHLENIAAVQADERPAYLAPRSAQGSHAGSRGPARDQPKLSAPQHPLSKGRSQPDFINTQPQPGNGQASELDRLGTARKFFIDQQFEMKSFEPALNLLQLQKTMEDEMFESITIPQFSTDWQGANMYYVQDQTGEFLFLLAESVLDDSNCRSCLGIHRPFLFRAFGKRGPLFQISRPRGCHCCCCSVLPGMLPDVVVTMNDWAVGRVRQPWLAGGFTPTYLVCDADGNVVLKLKGQFSMDPKDVNEFSILQKKGTNWTKVGYIRRKQKRMQHSMATDADRFSITSPETLTVENKVTLIAAVVLLDFVQFEGKSAALTTGQASVPVNDGTVAVDVESKPWWPLCRFNLCDCFFCGWIMRF